MTELATSEKTQVTFSPGDKRFPAWGPDGQIAYQTSNQQAYMIPASGVDDHPVVERLWPVRDLVWSPDGAWLAFSKIRTDLIDAANIWVVQADGAEPSMLTHEPGLQYHPAWSLDGKKLAYSAGHGYGTYELYVMDADGTNRRQLTTNTSHEFLPAWSPDGTQIAYSSDASGDSEIWVMQADGLEPKQLTHSPGLDTRPAWSPDGRHIAFTTNRSGVLEIWVMNADGTDQRPLEQAGSGVCDPAWR